MDITNVCHVKNPWVPMRCAVKIIQNNKSCSNSFQWLCHFFRMAHRDETTKCYLRQLKAFTHIISSHHIIASHHIISYHIISYHITISPYHHITISPYHHIIISSYHHIIISSHYLILHGITFCYSMLHYIPSLCYLILHYVALHHIIKSSRNISHQMILCYILLY